MIWPKEVILVKQNSTLGSVVPLAMILLMAFMQMYSQQLFVGILQSSVSNKCRINWAIACAPILTQLQNPNSQVSKQPQNKDERSGRAIANTTTLGVPERHTFGFVFFVAKKTENVVLNLQINPNHPNLFAFMCMFGCPDGQKKSECPTLLFTKVITAT